MSAPTAKTAQDIKLKPRTGDVLIEENLDFRGLLLSDSVQQGLTKAGFERPSPIQLKAIPLGRCGLDLIVQAKSGTGKTCVFAVIALEGIMLDSLATQVLVLAPTREIAVQISDVINDIGSCMAGLQCQTFIGGTPLHEDRQKLTRCHIAVGTPGRIKQLIEENALSTSNIRLFVLDEADKLLENSFQDQINWIYSALTENKQMLALSATYPEALAQHLTAYMRNPTFLRLNATDPALLGIRQYYRTVKFHPLPNKLFDNKTDALIELLSSVDFHQCLVFSNYQMRAQSLSEVLNFRGWPATYISGSREQQDRMAAMASLKQMTCRVLISTDLTSRGIDAENVNLVVNLDVPLNHETYLHRIGRAGRFGTYGAGVTLVAEGKEMTDLRRLETECNTNIKQLPDPIPKDLAHSSGFVSLDHLVTTETLVTEKGKVLSRPIESSVKGQVENISKSEKCVEVTDQNKEVKMNGKVKSYGPRSKSYGPRAQANCDASEGGVKRDDSPRPEQEHSSSLASEVGTISVSQNPEPNEKKNMENVCISVGSTNGATTNNSLSTQNAVSSQPDNVEKKEPPKPKWKKNNIWTDMSFNYTDEWNELDEKREKEEREAQIAARNERQENPRRRRQGQAGRRGAAEVESPEDGRKNSTPQPKDKKKSLPLLPVENKERKESKISDSSANKDQEQRSGVDLCSSEYSPLASEKPSLKMPSLREMRGEGSHPQAFADISCDYRKYTIGEVCDKEGIVPEVPLQRSPDNAVARYAQYLESVKTILQDDSQENSSRYRAEKKHYEERTPPKCEKPIKLDSRPCQVKKSHEKMLQEKEIVGTKTSEEGNDKKPTVTPTDSQSLGKGSLKDHAMQASIAKTISRGEDGGRPKEKITTDSSSILSNKETKDEMSHNKKTSSGIGGTKTVKTPAELLMSYDTLKDNSSYSESDQSAQKVAGQEQSDTDVSSAITSISSKPTKSRRRVDPYGPWSPYVPPEPAGQVPPDQSSNITDDEASNESLSEEESEWESSNLDCLDGEESEGLRQSRRQSSAKPTTPGHDFNWPPDYYAAHYNMWMAQQQMQYTTACYQNYMMHLQYAEYYKKLMKNQQKLWKMENYYLRQQNYIKEMAKWMSQHHQS